MRYIQHKKEAFWFYRFLSLFYDQYVNPFFWTPRMRDEALALVRLDRPDLTTIDVGSGTGFTTEGIVRHVDPAGVLCVDQSPHQMAQARRKPALQSCQYRLGDAEEIPAPTDHFDRYVSAGSIEYWPEPQRGIAEAYRVLKPGGTALVIGPLRPVSPLARAVADAWMLFPEEDDYRRWFRDAGFQDVRVRYVKPGWVARERYGIAIAGTKPTAGLAPVELPAVKQESLYEPLTPARLGQLVGNVVVGSAAGFLFIPAAVFGYARTAVRRILTPAEPDATPLDPLTPHQTTALFAVSALFAWLLARLFRRRGA